LCIFTTKKKKEKILIYLFQHKIIKKKKIGLKNCEIEKEKGKIILKKKMDITKLFR